MHPAIAQVCTLNAPFELDVEDYAAGKCQSIELWWGKLDAFLKQHTVDDVRHLLHTHQMAAPVISFQGGLLVSQGEARRTAWELFEQRLTTARAVGANTLVVTADVVSPPAMSDLERMRVSLAEAAQRAAAHGLRIALEFQASSLFCNNLDTATALVVDVDQPSLGVCLDAFQFFVGPSKFTDLRQLPVEKLFHVQLSDVAGVFREVASDADRILPGDGDFDLPHLVAQLQALGYTGHVSVELMNPQMFQIPPRSFGEIAITALRRVLGLAVPE